MPSDRIRIVHCLNHYMPVHRAGTELYTHALALAQQQAGYEVSILVPHFDYYRPGMFSPQYVYEGVNVFQYFEPSRPDDREIVFGRKPPEGLKNFSDVLHALQPDVVHFQELNRSTGFGLPHVKTARNAGATVFITMHLAGYTCNTGTLIRNGDLCSGRIDALDCTVCSFKTSFGMLGIAALPAAMAGILYFAAGLTRKVPSGKITTMLSMPATIRRIKNELTELADNADQLISLTEWYKKILVENGVPPGKITMIPQRLATGQAPAVRKAVPATLPIKVVFIGRIQPQKGVHLLIEAAKSFPAEKLTVDIYGLEEDTAYYRECFATADSTSNIRLMGPLDREKVVAKLAEYYILCLPSTFSEMSPLVIQEAFAAGIPVLGSRVMGNAEQITPGKTGLLFTFESAKDLQMQFNRIITEPALIDRMKSQITPPGTFNETAAQYMELIKTFTRPLK